MWKVSKALKATQIWYLNKWKGLDITSYPKMAVQLLGIVKSQIWYQSNWRDMWRFFTFSSSKLLWIEKSYNSTIRQAWSKPMCRFTAVTKELSRERIMTKLHVFGIKEFKTGRASVQLLTGWIYLNPHCTYQEELYKWTLRTIYEGFRPFRWIRKSICIPKAFYR